MNTELFLQVASVTASVIGLVASVFIFIKTKKRAEESSKKSFLGVISESRNKLDILGITLSGFLHDDNISESLKNKIHEGVRVRALLPNDGALESWARSIDLPNEQIAQIIEQHEESIRRLKEYGAIIRAIDHVAANTAIISDDVVANKFNYTLIGSESSPLLIMQNLEYVKEYQHMFEGLWQTSKENMNKEAVLLSIKKG